jgi:hypothetical protein
VDPEVLNGNFAEGSTDANFQYTTAPNWQGSGSVFIRSGNAAWGSTSAAEGDYFLGLQKKSAYIKQTVPNHVSGRSYQLVFSSAKRSNNPGSGDPVLDVSIDGVSKKSFTPTSSAFSQTIVDYTATSSNADIQFANGASNDQDLTVFVDKISIQQAGACQRPPSWCSHTGSTYKDDVDCDGDGIVDPHCADEKGDNGFVPSKTGCVDNWPNGVSNTCKAKSCPRPNGWCSHAGSSYKDNVDCDGDGVADPHCNDNKGNNGFLSAKLGCTDNFPNAVSNTCKAQSCPRPAGWCSHPGSTYKDNVDCDGDGVPDPHCSDTQGQNGFVYGSSCTTDTWPNGVSDTCKAGNSLAAEKAQKSHDEKAKKAQIEESCNVQMDAGWCGQAEGPGHVGEVGISGDW